MKGLRFGRDTVLVLLLAAVCSVLYACAGDVSDDPDEVAKRTVAAAYQRDYGFLHEYASAGLKQHYGLDEQEFSENLESGLNTGYKGDASLDEALSKGRIDTDDAEVNHTEFMGFLIYNVLVEDPDGEATGFEVVLTRGSENGYSYCDVTLLDPEAEEEERVTLIASESTSECSS